MFLKRNVLNFQAAKWINFTIAHLTKHKEKKLFSLCLIMNFPPFYVINLKKDTKRLESIAKGLSRYNFDFQRIDAIYGNELSSKEIQNNTTFTCSNICTNSVIGCAMSHLQAWETMISNRNSYAIILEDDAEFIENFDRELRLTLDKMPKDTDILYLGCLEGCNVTKKYTDDVLTMMFRSIIPHKKQHKVINDRIFVPEFPLALHGYVISNNAARFLVSKIKGKISTHIDAEILRLSLSLNTYASYPKLVFQTVSNETSNIALQFPIIFNYFAGKIRNADGTPLSYKLSSPLCQIMNYHVNLYTLLFFIIGVLLKLKPRNLLILLSIFNVIELSLSSMEALHGTTIQVIGTDALILLGYCLIKK